MKIKMRHPFMIRAAATTSDGTHAVSVMSLLIMIDSHEHAVLGDSTPLPHLDNIEKWIDTYIADRDLTATLEVPLTPSMLAYYFLRVFSGMDTDVAAVSVSIDGGPVALVSVSDD